MWFMQAKRGVKIESEQKAGVGFVEHVLANLSLLPT